MPLHLAITKFTVPYRLNSAYSTMPLSLPPGTLLEPAPGQKMWGNWRTPQCLGQKEASRSPGCGYVVDSSSGTRESQELPLCSARYENVGATDAGDGTLG